MKFLGQKNITQSDINCPAITFPVKYTELIINKLGEGESKVYGPRKRAFPMKVHKNRSTGRVVFTSVKKFFDMYDVLPGVTVQLFEDDQSNFWMLPERKDFCAPWENAGADLIMKKQVVESEMRSNDKVFIWLTSKPALIRQIHTSNSITVLADNGKLYTFQASVERLPKVAQGMDSLCCWKWSRANDFITELKVQIGDYLFLWSDVQHRLRVSCQSNPGPPSTPGGHNASLNQLTVDVSQGMLNAVVKDEKDAMLNPLQQPPAFKPTDDSKDACGSDKKAGEEPKGDLSGLNLLAKVAEDLEKKEGKSVTDDKIPGSEGAPFSQPLDSTMPTLLNDTLPTTQKREFDWPLKLPTTGTELPILPGVPPHDAFPPMSMGSIQGPPAWHPLPPPRDTSGNPPPLGSYQPGSPTDDITGAILTGRMGSNLGMLHGSPSKGMGRDGANLDAGQSQVVEQITSALSQMPPSRMNGGEMNDLVNVLVNALQKKPDGRDEGRKRGWGSGDANELGQPSKRVKVEGRGFQSLDMAGRGMLPESRYSRAGIGRDWGGEDGGIGEGLGGKSNGKGYGQNSYFQSVWRYESAVDTIMGLNDALYNMIKERHAILRELKDGDFQSKYKSLMMIEQELRKIRKQLQQKYMEAAEIIASSDI